jgi:hypothetical protein
MARQTAGSRARQSGKSEAQVRQADELVERGQRTIYVDGKPHAIVSLDDLEWGEMAELEEYLGYPIGDRIGELGSSIKASLFLYYLARRREDPTYTLQEAERTRITSVSQSPPEPDEGDESAAEPDPTPAAGG